MNETITLASLLPHGMCLLWNPNLIWFHIAADGLIAAAYFTIPIGIAYFVKRRGDLDYPHVFWMFAAFITLCGATHLFSIVTLWEPLWWTSGALKMATALVSMTTALAVWWLMPKLLAIPSPSDLSQTNQRLANEIMQRQRDAIVLAASENRFRCSFDYAPHGMAVLLFDGSWLQANIRVCEMLGMSEQELAATSLQALIPNQDDQWRGLEPLLNGASHSYRVELPYEHPDGDTRWLDIAVSAFPAGDDEDMQLILHMQDVTKRRMAEQAVRQARDELEERVEARTRELAEVNERLKHIASHDALTDLPNRRYFMENMTRMLSGARRYDENMSLMMIDLDDFKNINDTLGHPAGDEAIRLAANTLRHGLRESDLIARLGGDEFCVLLPNADRDQAAQVAEKLKKDMAKASVSDDTGKTIHLGCSIGIVTLTPDIRDPDAMLNLADKALYEDKKRDS